MGQHTMFTDWKTQCCCLFSLNLSKFIFNAIFIKIKEAFFFVVAKKLFLKFMWKSKGIKIA